VSRGVEAVEGKIAFTPVEILFGEVQTRRPHARKGRANGETARVGEAVQNFRPGDGGLVFE
jgi:hypothetical protein